MACASRPFSLRGWPRRHKVLSLEDQCLLHLVCRLEEFPPESLASLSVRLRRRLLLRLPAVDVFQLQNLTSVTQGIDMDESVWKYRVHVTMRSHRLSRTYEWLLPPLGEPGSGFTRSFVDLCFTCLLTGMIQFVRLLLFSSIDSSLGIDSWKGLVNDTATVGGAFVKYLTPLRYAKRLCEPLAFLMEACSYRPRRLLIHCPARRELEAGVLSQCLSQVQALCFVCPSCFLSQGNARVFGTPRRLVEDALSQPQRMLRELKVVGTTEFIRHVVNDLTGILSPPLSQLEPPHPCEHYSGLVHIEIKICKYRGSSSLLSYKEEEVHYQLRHILHHQTLLTSLTLDQWDANERDWRRTPCVLVEMYSAIGKLFDRPHFKELRLVNILFNWDMLEAVVAKFLVSNAQEGERILCLEKPRFLPDTRYPSDTLYWHSDGPQHKTLVISDVKVYTDYSDYAGEVLRWLTRIHFSHFLSSFTFTTNLCGELVKPVSGGDLDESISMYRPISAEFFQCLFGPHLKVLSFRYLYFGSSNHLPALTEGLLAQESRELCSLNLEGCGLGKSRESDLSTFFDVLFSLPQLSQLELNLKHNELKGQHFSLMHQSWKNALSQTTSRLKHLMIGGNKYEDYMNRLQELTAGGDFASL